jgi:hypothetical protein
MHQYEQMLKFGAGGDTFVNPIALVLVLAAIILILVVPRRDVLLPFLISCFFIPLGQVIVIGGLHFYVLRFLILSGWIRLVASGWLEDYKPRPIDKVIVLWALVDTVAFVLLWGQWDALVNRLAFLYDLLGSYFLFRVLYRGPKDIDRAVKSFAVICFALGLCMMNEKITGRNLFWVFGGVPEFTGIRVGSLRAQGPFAHPILAGTFGAILLPLFAGLCWREGKGRWLPALGIVSAIAMIIASASSTPILTALAGLFGLFLWPLRRHMRLFRWGIVLLLTGLHLMMKAPVWALIGRIEIVGGSSADHRYELVNKFILHFGDWWLIGTKYTGDWGYLMHDVSNQFVGVGTEGGLAGFALYIAIIVCCFQALGTARKSNSSDRLAQRRLWSLGAALFACVVAFFGIAFFDQTAVVWYSLLAMITVSTQLPVTSKVVSLPQRATREAVSDDLTLYNPGSSLGRMDTLQVEVGTGR